MDKQNQTPTSQPVAGNALAPKTDAGHPQPPPKLDSGSITAYLPEAFPLGDVVLSNLTVHLVDAEDLLLALQSYARRDWGGCSDDAENNRKAITEVMRESSEAWFTVHGTFTDRHGRHFAIKTTF